MKKTIEFNVENATVSIEEMMVFMCTSLELGECKYFDDVKKPTEEMSLRLKTSLTSEPVLHVLQSNCHDTLLEYLKSFQSLLGRCTDTRKVGFAIGPRGDKKEVGVTLFVNHDNISILWWVASQCNSIQILIFISKYL
jgi:hypothetical protein